MTGALLRVDLGLSDSGLKYEMENQDEVVDVPASASFHKQLPEGILGVDAGVSMWPGRRGVGVESRWRSESISITTADTLYTDRINTWRVGASFRVELPNDVWRLLGGLSYHRFSILLFRFSTEDVVTPELLQVGVGGARTSLGFGVSLDRFSAELELAGTWAPWLVNREIGSLVDWVVYEGIFVRLGAAYEQRSTTLEVGSQEVGVGQNRGGLSMGLGYVF